MGQRNLHRAPLAAQNSLSSDRKIDRGFSLKRAETIGNMARPLKGLCYSRIAF